MVSVTVSSKYQIVIPKEIRSKTNVNPGMKLQLISFNDRIEIIPVRRASDLRGFLKGIDTEIQREKDRL